MERTAILLNGGREHEVTPSAGADTYLIRLIGSEAAIRAVFFLRSMVDTEGIERVAVFVGSNHVGYLPPDIDDGVLATVKACEMHTTSVRARGTLSASWEQPGRVTVRVDLSDSEHLLASSLSEQQPASQAARAPEPVQAPEPAPTSQSEEPRAAAPTLSAALEDAAAFMDFDYVPEERAPTQSYVREPERPADPVLSAGYTEDYPDWPPPSIKSPAPTSPTSPDDAYPASPQPSPSPQAEPETPADEPAAYEPAAYEPAAYEPAAYEPAAYASPEALLATRSAWAGNPEDSQPAQPGWLASRPPRPTQPPAPGEHPDTPSGPTT